MRRDLIDTREEHQSTTATANGSEEKYVYPCICDCIIHSCLDEHLALGARLDGGAVDRHGLAITRELQGELLLHQLPDHLTDENEGEKSRNYRKEEEDGEHEEEEESDKAPELELRSCICGQLSGSRG